MQIGFLRRYFGRGWKWYLNIPLMLYRVLRHGPQGLRLFLWRAIQNKPRHDVIIKTKNGLLTVDSADHGISARLFIEREYELDYLKGSLRVLHEQGMASRSGTLLDIGANIGMVAIGALNHDYFERAVAIEPGPNNFRLLEINVAQNNLAERISCHQYAFSSQAGVMEYEVSAENCGDNRLRISNSAEEKLQESSWETITVEAIALDDFVIRYPDDFQNVSLIWLDIQGHEGHFFKGAEQFLSAQNIPIVCEVWPYGIARANMTAEEYIASIPANYTHFYLLHKNRADLREISRLAEIFTAHQEDTEDEQIILIPR